MKRNHSFSNQIAIKNWPRSIVILTIGVTLALAGCASSSPQEDGAANPELTAAPDGNAPLPDSTGAATPELDDTGGAPKKSLFDRLGGKDFMTKFADKFVETVKVDPTIGKNAKVADAMKGDLSHFKSGLADYFCHVTGGPCEYKGKSLKEAHQGMGISETEWKVMGSLLIKVLRDMGVSGVERKELANLTSMTKYDIIKQ